MRIHIALDECEAHGMCALHEPDLYQLDDEGYAANADFPVPRVWRPQHATAQVAAR